MTRAATPGAEEHQADDLKSADEQLVVTCPFLRIYRVDRFRAA